MSADSESLPNPVQAVTASRFRRNGPTVYNLVLRLTGSPGASWHAAVAAFAAVAERVPADAPEGIDDQDLLLMSCWHARQMLGQLDADPGYAAQLRAHDAAQAAHEPVSPAVAAAHAALPVDQRELLGMSGLGGLDHARLATLLGADPGLLAVMVAESRLMLHDALYGGTAAADALQSPDDRQALALAALRQDGQLTGSDAAARLQAWIDADPAHADTVAALEAAGDAYRAWPLAAVPAGLLEAAVAASASVVPPPSAGPQGQAEQTSAPAPAAAPVGPSAPGGGALPPDPHATVEWSSSDIAALGLEGAPEPETPTGQGVREDVDAQDANWEQGWDEDQDELPPSLRAPAETERQRAPRWHIALVGVLLVAVIVVLVLLFSSSDDPTPAGEPATTGPTPTTTKKSSSRDQGAVPVLHARIQLS